MKRLVAIAAAVTVALAAAATASALPTPQAMPPFVNDGQRYCPSGALVVNVTQSVQNDADAGRTGLAWAWDNYTRTIQVVRLSGNTYCAGLNYSGAFWTWPGLSPGATGSVPFGLAGTFSGVLKTTVFTATFNPKVVTTGSIGTFDYGCDASITCPGFVDWVSLWFDNVRNLGTDRWGWSYYTPANGYWYDYSTVLWGDITG
jgi:hypothetical protein